MVTEPAKLRIRDILNSLTVAQLWGTIGAIIGVLVGTFTFGYLVSESLQRKNLLDVTNLEEEVTGISEKNRFLALYLRYELAKEEYKANTDDNDESFQNYNNALKSFNKYVRERVDSKDLILHKGERKLATIRFSDGTIWTIPPELHVAELH